MDDNTKFLIRRMDSLEARLLKEIKEIQKEAQKIQQAKNRLLGFMFGSSFVVSFVMQVVFHKLGG